MHKKLCFEIGRSEVADHGAIVFRVHATMKEEQEEEDIDMEAIDAAVDKAGSGEHVIKATSPVKAAITPNYNPWHEDLKWYKRIKRTATAAFAPLAWLFYALSVHRQTRRMRYLSDRCVASIMAERAAQPRYHPYRAPVQTLPKISVPLQWYVHGMSGVVITRGHVWQYDHNTGSKGHYIKRLV